MKQRKVRLWDSKPLPQFPSETEFFAAHRLDFNPRSRREWKLKLSSNYKNSSTNTDLSAPEHRFPLRSISYRCEDLVRAHAEHERDRVQSNENHEVRKFVRRNMRFRIQMLQANRIYNEIFREILIFLTIRLLRSQRETRAPAFFLQAHNSSMISRLFCICKATNTARRPCMHLS